MNITKEQLDNLIKCQKVITRPPKKHMVEQNQCRRNDFFAHSAELNATFHIFMRQNLILPEDFSVGLQWQTHDYGNIIILRCNGPHGGNRSLPLHFVPHIHRLNISLAQTDHFRENDTCKTESYSTFEGAIAHFCSICHIQGAEKYFPYINQQTLF